MGSSAKSLNGLVIAFSKIFFQLKGRVSIFSNCAWLMGRTLASRHKRFLYSGELPSQDRISEAGPPFSPEERGHTLKEVEWLR